MNAPFVKPYIKNEKDGWLEIGGAEDFSVFRTFDCGQCFRFAPPAAPQLPEQVDGVAFGKKVSFAGHDGTLFVRSSPEDFENIWRSYLDLDTDYSAISEFVVSVLPDGGGREHMKKAAEASRGIHILRQDSWEALCSFIISQNNNIPRIRKIIAAMSAAYGDDLVGGYAFPKPQALSDAGEDANICTAHRLPRKVYRGRRRKSLKRKAQRRYGKCLQKLRRSRGAFMHSKRGRAKGSLLYSFVRIRT